MNRKKSYFKLLFATLTLVVLLSISSFSNTVFAQSEKISVTERDYENQEVAMADTFREEGKIYVVVAVLATIFVGITVYLISTDLKIRKLEEELKYRD